MAAIVGGSPPARSSPLGARSSLDQLIQTATEEFVSNGLDPALAVIATPAGGVVVGLNGPGGTATLERWLDRSRRPTAAERARAVPHRIQLATATHTAPLRELVASCPDPALAAEVESGDRTLRAGERFKCAVR
jgi:hypothetical protein